MRSLSTWRRQTSRAHRHAADRRRPHVPRHPPRDDPVHLHRVHHDGRCYVCRQRVLQVGACQRQGRRPYCHRALHRLLQLQGHQDHVAAHGRRRRAQGHEHRRHVPLQEHPHHDHDGRLEPQESTRTTMACADGRNSQVAHTGGGHQPERLSLQLLGLGLGSLRGGALPDTVTRSTTRLRSWPTARAQAGW